MSPEPTHPAETPAAFHDGDHDRTQNDVLCHLLGLYPAQLTIDEVVREITVASDEFAATDRIRNAIRDLVATGLLHRNGEFITPTRAAVRSAEIRE